MDIRVSAAGQAPRAAGATRRGATRHRPSVRDAPRFGHTWPKGATGRSCDSWMRWRNRSTRMDTGGNLALVTSSHKRTRHQKPRGRPSSQLEPRRLVQPRSPWSLPSPGGVLGERLRVLRSLGCKWSLTECGAAPRPLPTSANGRRAPFSPHPTPPQRARSTAAAWSRGAGRRARGAPRPQSRRVRAARWRRPP